MLPPGYLFDDCANYNRCVGWGQPNNAASALGVATTNWTSGLPANAVPAYDELYPIDLSPNHDLAFDVTGTVKDWLSQKTPNLGFVVSAREGFVKNDREMFWDYYDSYQLEVQYFK